MYKHIIWDTNNLYYRAYSVTSSKHANIEGVKIFTGGIVESLNRIKDLQNRYGYDNSKHYFLFDNPDTAINIRKFLSDGKYKQSRYEKKVKDGLHKTLNILAEILKNYSDNFYILWSERLEADDLTLPLLRNFKLNEDERALLISSDLDWARNISEYSHWFNWKKLYDINVFKDQYKYKPSRESIILYKTIRGDKVDDISPGMPYLPKKLLPHIVSNYSNVQDLITNMWDDPVIPSEWCRKIKEHKLELLTNQPLIDFIEIDKPVSEIINTCKRNEKQCRIWFKALNMSPESWMQTEKEFKDSFFKKQKYDFK